jgi:hypothetical protein
VENSAKNEVLKNTVFFVSTFPECVKCVYLQEVIGKQMFSATADFQPVFSGVTVTETNRRLISYVQGKFREQSGNVKEQNPYNIMVFYFKCQGGNIY